MAIVLPETEMEEAALLANKLCARIRRHVFLGADGAKELHVTSSLGVADFRPDLDGPAQMVEAADEALYQAKGAGPKPRGNWAGM